MSALGTVDVRFSYKGRRTTCTISRQGESIVHSFMKRCVDDPEFTKEERRKRIFKKAMDQASGLLSKTERTEIWNNFRTKIKQPVKK